MQRAAFIQDEPRGRPRAERPDARQENLSSIYTVKRSGASDILFKMSREADHTPSGQM
jgi:hypothetical protein